MDDRLEDEDDDDAEDEVASDGCHEGSRGLPLARGEVGSVMLALWLCGGLREMTATENKKKPGDILI